MHTESDHFLPPHPTTQIWVPTFLVWIYWDSLLSDLSVSIYVPLAQSSTQKPLVALHVRVVAKFLQRVTKALHDLASYDLPDLISNYWAWFTQLPPHWPLAVPRKCFCLGNSFPIPAWLTPCPPSSLSSDAMLLRRPPWCPLKVTTCAPRVERAYHVSASTGPVCVLDNVFSL